MLEQGTLVKLLHSNVAACCVVYIVLITTYLQHFTEPQMKHLNSIVVPRVAAYWNDIALNLDFTIQATEIISKKCFYDPESCCKELFKQWLISSKGKSPKIWSTLLTSLKCMKDLRAVTEEIEKELEILTTEVSIVVIYLKASYGCLY